MTGRWRNRRIRRLNFAAGSGVTPFGPDVLIARDR
jgi:hypothetical protein